MTKQEMYEIIRAGMLAQGKPARSPEGCKYRTREGLKCAVGMLIPDSEYSPSMEGKRPSELGFTETDFLDQVQLWHDFHLTYELLKINLLDQIAERHGLLCVS
jgi:hypothetical protein